MCFKPTEEEASRARERLESERRLEEPEPLASPPPRGNQAPDHDEVDKSVEKLHSIVAQ